MNLVLSKTTSFKIWWKSEVLVDDIYSALMSVSGFWHVNFFTRQRYIFLAFKAFFALLNIFLHSSQISRKWLKTGHTLMFV